jgi:hypothetical protein
LKSKAKKSADRRSDFDRQQKKFALINQCVTMI